MTDIVKGNQVKDPKKYFKTLSTAVKGKDRKTPHWAL